MSVVPVPVPVVGGFFFVPQVFVSNSHADGGSHSVKKALGRSLEVVKIVIQQACLRVFYGLTFLFQIAFPKTHLFARNCLLASNKAFLEAFSFSSVLEKSWIDCSKEELKSCLQEIHKKYLQEKDSAQGFVVKIFGLNDFSVIPKYGDSRTLTPCAEKSRCALCNIKAISIPGNESAGGLGATQHAFVLLKSLSGTPLIIDKKQLTYNWFYMTPNAQEQMIEAAQKVARVLPKNSTKQSYLELHCHPPGLQSIGHTHLRLEKLYLGQKPTKQIWHTLESNLLAMNPKKMGA